MRVPRLKGERMGVFATRSPHRPCPIGLTVAKVEAVRGNMVLLSGVDLVDGTPVLDVKPYLPYCDSIEGATIAKWVMVDNFLSIGSVSFSNGFSSSLCDCWATGNSSLYESPQEFQSLIKQVLSWDIRSVSQRNRPHNAPVTAETSSGMLDLDEEPSEEDSNHGDEQISLVSEDIIYHLILEGMDVSYRINGNGNVLVEKVTVSSDSSKHKLKCRDA